MKGIILAGGRGTRLHPLTAITNKMLLPVYDKPMILYPLETLKRSGITDITIVSTETHLDAFRDFFADGAAHGVRLSYCVQREQTGSANALACAEEFAGGERLAVIFGDNIFENDFAENVRQFEAGNDHSGPRGAMVFLKAVPDPHRFGIAETDGPKIKTLEEKPKEPKSNLAATGFYLFDETIFDKIRMTKPSERNELELTEAYKKYLDDGQLYWAEVVGFWSDAGTFDSLHEAAAWAKGRAKAEEEK